MRLTKIKIKRSTEYEVLEALKQTTTMRD